MDTFFQELLAWMPIAAAGIAAAAQLGGSFMSAQGAAGANAANVEMQRVANEQTMAAQIAGHEQNTAFMEDSQANSIFQQDMAQQFNSAEAEKARLFSSNEANQQRVFQERMASSAYATAMADMKRAGLNPILAYQQGGAATPSGAMGSGPAASASGGSAGSASAMGAPSLRAANVLNDKEAIGRAIGNVVQSALDVTKNIEGIDLLKQQNRESQQREVVGAAQARKLHYETLNEEEKIHQTKADTVNKETLNAILKSQGLTAAQIARITSREADDTDRYGSKATPAWLERILRTIQGQVEKLPAPNIRVERRD